VIEQLGGKLTQVVINELADETFFAKLIVDAGGRHVEVDARPSDAIALAIRAKVPIYVEESVFEQAGLVFENEETEGEVEAEEATEVDEENGFVLVDTNHPLAGMTLEFEVCVVSIRDTPATAGCGSKS
jgi:hypothetical protein